MGDQENLLDEEALYAEALAELKSGNPRPGLWAKAFAESDGDDSKSQALYIKLRVQLDKERKLQERETARVEAVESERQKAADFLAVIERLRVHGYEARKSGNGWTVREPLGGRVKLNSDQALLEFAEGRMSGPSPKSAHAQNESTSPLPPSYVAKPAGASVVMPSVQYQSAVREKLASQSASMTAAKVPSATVEEPLGELMAATYWSRLWARCLDLPVAWVLVSAIGLFVPDFHSVIPSVGGLVLDIIAGAFLSCLVILGYEIFFLSHFGATPGKMLFGLIVRSTDDRLPTTKASRIRAWVYLKSGLYFGLFFPYMQLLGAIFAWQRKSGSQPWDMAARTMIVQRPIGTVRFIGAAILAFATFTAAALMHQVLKQVAKQEIRKSTFNADVRPKTSGAPIAGAGRAPTYDSKGWTEESTGSSESGPWLQYSPPGTRYYRDANRIIYRVYPPGVRPDAKPANPFGLGDSTAEVPR